MEHCPWAKTELDIAYHDAEWGVPVHSDQTLFEFLILEGAQAGLSWSTILKKRAEYRRAYNNFDPKLVAAYGLAKTRELLGNPGIVRNRLKIAASIQNAKAFTRVQEEFGSFDTYLWGFVNGRPMQSRRTSMSEIPARTTVSDALSRDLKTRGFNFVGSTICYAFMQAVGLVNDHLVSCPRRAVCRRLGGA